jgi:transcriptional regulator with XRE-family HTH domain
VKSTLTAASPTAETSFRLFLQSELARRCARNAQYSMRAFAMHLDIDHSTLSQWLRGRRSLTVRSIESMGRRLGLDENAIQRYVDYAGRDEGPCSTTMLSAETVALISDWHHFAILELTSLGGFQADSRWISRVLDISVDEVDVALQRLIRLDLLDMAAADRWVDRSGDATVNIETLEAGTIERQQGQSRRLSASALRSIPIALREHSTITLAVNSEQLARAFELSARFRQQLIDLLRDGPADDVYQIEVAIFPVTTKKRENPYAVSGRAVADSGEGS